MITGEIRLGGQLDGVAQKIRSVPVRAERLSADAEPYARWDDGVLAIGIPDAECELGLSVNDNGILCADFEEDEDDGQTE